MGTFINLSTISLVYSGIPSVPETFIRKSGNGSLYTYKVYGTAGQSVEVRGGFVGDTWEDMQQIAVLTVNDPNPVDNPQSAVVQHTWPVLAVQGAAQVKIARGHA